MRYNCSRLSVFRCDSDATCPAFSLVEAVGATERFFVVLLQSKTHAAGLFRSVDEVRGRKGLAKVSGRSHSTHGGGSCRGRSVRSAKARCGLLSRQGRRLLLTAVNGVGFQRQR